LLLLAFTLLTVLTAVKRVYRGRSEVSSETTVVRPDVRPAVPPTRRERLRAQTLGEIKSVARKHLVEGGGPGAIQLRAIARDLGMTAPALYRYFPSLDELVLDLTVDLFDEVIAALEAGRDCVADNDVCVQLQETSRAFRRWSIHHPTEFALMFATPPAAFATAPSNACEEAAARFGAVFAALFARLWQEYPFDVPSDEELGAAVVAELSPYHSWLIESLQEIPLGAVTIFLEAWVRLYGVVALEVFGHLSWAMANGEPMFERTLQGIGEMFGVPDTYRPPASLSVAR
jgi:AcrR family transcriptional regulator